MAIGYELKRRFRRAIGPGLCALLVAYFGFHAVNGEYGLVSWMRLSNEISRLRADLVRVEQEREHWAHKVSLMRPDGLDPDMLDEQARGTLGLAAPDELVILESPVAPAP